jgi:hypothetical protein
MSFSLKIAPELRSPTESFSRGKARLQTAMPVSSRAANHTLTPCISTLLQIEPSGVNPTPAKIL